LTRYRIFVLDRDGRIVSGHAITCAADDEACAIAREMLLTGQEAAVWDQSRRVGLVSVAWPASRAGVPPSRLATPVPAEALMQLGYRTVH
jgi:hypothetical protein